MAYLTLHWLARYEIWPAIKIGKGLRANGDDVAAALVRDELIVWDGAGLVLQASPETVLLYIWADHMEKTGDDGE